MPELKHRKTFLQWLKLQPIVYKTIGERNLYLFGISRQDAIEISSDLPLRRNSWKDIEQFRQTDSWLPRDVFLRTARDRIENGIDAYTLVENGVLCFYGWVQRNTHESRFPYVDQTVRFPTGTATFFNAFVHPSARQKGLYTKAICHCVIDSFLDENILYFIDAVEERNHAARRGNNKAGLREIALLTTRYRFGVAIRTAKPAPKSPPLQFVDSALDTLTNIEH